MRARVVFLGVVAALATTAGPAAAAGPQSLSHPGFRSRFVFIDRAVTARVSPSLKARAVGRLTTRTGDQTDELVGVLGEHRVGGQDWLRVQLPIRPTGATGWIPRTTAGEMRYVSTWLRISRKALKATLIRSGKVIFTARIGVGRAKWPTPTGFFYIRDRLVPSDPGGMYGPVAFGTSAHSDVLTDWPGGGYIGIHGTNQPGLLPGRVSHGCIRMANADIQRLDPLLPVGTPVTIT